MITFYWDAIKNSKKGTKIFWAIFALIFFVILLVGCGDDDSSSNNPPEPTVQTNNEVNFGDGWPDVKSSCSPDQPNVRIYVTKLHAWSGGYGAAGAAIAVIEDMSCP